MSRVLLIFELCFLCCCAVWSQEIGENCEIRDSGKSGICTNFRECPAVVEDFKSRGKHPTVCAYQQSQVIVCCPTLSRREEKCREYGEYVYETVVIPSFRSNGRPIVQKNDKCGRTSAKFIVGGVAALSREYPHSALLGYRVDKAISWKCGGSLVSSRYVLTAGHCLTHSNFGSVVKVRLGELDYSTSRDDATPRDFNVEKKIPYPEYQTFSSYHDIALIKLDSQAKLSPYIRPICLPTSDTEPAEYIATGWGSTKLVGDQTTALLKVKLQSYDYAECEPLWSNNLNRKFRNGLQSTQLCAGHRSEKRDTCGGDSGGPLQIYHPDVWCSCIQLGITSFGIGCASNFPGVYTKVFQYADWIEGIIWAPGEDF